MKRILLFLIIVSVCSNLKLQAQSTCNTGIVTTAGGHTAEFLGVTYNGVYPNITSTFTYKVTSGFSPSISHFNFGNLTCQSCMSSSSDFASVSSGGAYSIGTDPTTGMCGIKYDYGINGGQSSTVSFTLAGYFDLGTITFAAKAGTDIDYAPICGPVCTSNYLNLGNLVWNDLNSNGIKDIEEPEVRGITVKLYFDNNKDNVPDGAAIATTTTNASGIYNFGNLAPSNYIVGVTLGAGYTSTITTTTSSNPNNDKDNDNNGVTIVSGELRSNYITLSLGGEPPISVDGDGTNGNLTLDFGLRGTGSIGDFVWNDVNGNGIQDVGEAGISGATVTLTYSNGTQVTTTTNATGAYLFSNLVPGTYTVTFTTPTGYYPTLSNQGTDDRKDSDPVAGSTSVTLTAAQNNLTVDAGFYIPLNLGNTVWLEISNNGTKNTNEPGISGATVKLYADVNGDNIPDGAAVATTTTDASGVYSFTNLSSGNYIVGVTIPTGYVGGATTTSSSTPNNDTDNDNNGVTTVTGELRSNFITLSVGGEPASGVDGDGTNGNLTLDFGLRGTGSIGDFVWNDVNGNGIQDVGEAGISGATVTLTYSNGTQVTTTTNASGAYLFSNLAPGTYTVTFTTPSGYNPTLSNQGTDDTKDSDPVAGSTSVTLTAGQNNLTVDAGFYIQLFNLGNTVWFDVNNNGLKDTNELGISGLTVKLYADANGDNIPDGAAVATTTTNASGVYSFTNLSGGNYIVGVTLPTGYVAGATTVNSSNPNSDTDNDNNGVTTVSGELRSNFITLSINSEPASGVDGDGVNGNLTLDFGLRGTLNLGNLVWNDTNADGDYDGGEPVVSGVTVRLYNDANGDNVADGAAIATTTTNAQGLYSFSNLIPTKYIVGIVIPTGYIASVNVASSANPDNDINDDNNGVNFQGANVAGTEVRSNFITLSANGEPASAIDGDGTNGNLTLDFGICGLGGLGDFVWNDLNANGIKDASEIGLAGVNVTLTYPDGTQVTYPTDANGYYFFANLGPGNYTVTFATPTGMIASPSNQGTNDAVDSDPVGGVVNVTLAASQINDTVDAGFYAQLNVGNTVWFDANNNGLKDTNEPGISGLTVKLYADANGDNIPDGAAIATTTTIANGTYSFTNLSAGNYIVGVTLPTGYVASATTINSSTPNSDTDNDNNGVTTVSGELRSNFITLSANGEPASGVDGDGTNGNLTLDFGLKGTLNLGNLVWNDTNGNGIKNTFESGITGVTVYLYQDANADNVPDGAAINSTTTTTGGIYAFSNLVPGNYIVGIATPTGFANSFKPTNNANPNSNVDNDNNGVIEASGIIRSNFITLSIGGEPDVAVDGDGTNGNLTLDFAVAKDTDGDKIPDVIDIDDDNDGITDLNESGGYDPLADCDGDGTPNYLDSTPGCTTPSGNDPWGKPYVALTWTDCNADGINDFFDWDRDGIINELDLDSDNDGILDVQEARPGSVAVTATVNGMITGTDADGNGLLSSYENGNTNPVLNGIQAQDLDRDGTPNFLDLDSDGDGMTDLTEALGIYSSTGVVTGTDTDGDGVKAENFGSSAASTADNINGFGAKGISLLNSDATIAGVSTGDTYPDAYDIDSDNDGITDNAEAQATCSYKLPSGLDCDGDGVDNTYDALSQCVTCTRTSGGLTPYDKDNDGKPDYIDLDTDNDGAFDIYEGHTVSDGNGGHMIPPVNYWTAASGDADRDGLIDYFDGFNILTQTSIYYRNVTNNNMGTNGSFDTGTDPTGSISQLPESDGKNGCAEGGERDWRTVTILPVKLLEFKGNLNNSNINLSWTVANELNMNMYEIERSTDAVNFTKVAIVKATAATASNKTYTSMDNVSSITANNVHYRLKQLDLNGSYVYSNVINFRLSGKAGSMSINPNPAVSYFNIKLNVVKEGMAYIKIIDMNGRVVNTQNTKVAQGVNSISFNNLSNFSAGTYNVQVMINGILYNEKLIVTK